MRSRTSSRSISMLIKSPRTGRNWNSKPLVLLLGQRILRLPQFQEILPDQPLNLVGQECSGDVRTGIAVNAEISELLEILTELRWKPQIESFAVLLFLRHFLQCAPI